MSAPKRPSSIASRKPIGKPLDRKVPANPKYAGVQSRIDTGASMSKMEEPSAARFQKREEPFKRIRMTSLGKLIEDEEEPESIYNLGKSEDGPKEYSKSYLILDVRDPDEYSKFHIRDARCYPALRLRHSANPFTPEIYAFTRDPTKTIIVYDEDEKAAHGAMLVFAQNGVENAYMLHGGVLPFAYEHPQLMEGTVPAKPKPKKKAVAGSSTQRSTIPRTPASRR